MKCTNCSKQIPNDSEYCIFCGSKLFNADQLEIASSSRRLINLIVDQIGYFVFALGVGIVLGLLGLVGDNTEDGLYTILGWIAVFLYYFLCEVLWGKTLGKVLTKTHVIADDGSTPTTGQIFKRSLFRFVPFEIFSFFGHYPIGWHDKWSRTRVVMD